MNQWQVRRQAQLDRMVIFESPGGGDGQLAQVTPVRARRYGAGLDPRQVEQIADQLRQPCALHFDGGDQPQALLGRYLRGAQRRGRGGDRRDRRPQVMRDGVEDRGSGHVGSARRLGFGHAFGHLLTLYGHVDQPGDRGGQPLDERLVVRRVVRHI